MLLTKHDLEKLSTFYLLEGCDISSFIEINSPCLIPLFIAQSLFNQSCISIYSTTVELHDLTSQLFAYLNESLTFDSFSQGLQIAYGLKSGLDISQYCDSTLYNSLQMQEIRLGLMSSIPINFYNKPTEYNHMQMQQVRIGLQHGIEIDFYNDPHKYSASEMLNIRRRLDEDGVYLS